MNILFFGCLIVYFAAMALQFAAVAFKKEDPAKVICNQRREQMKEKNHGMIGKKCRRPRKFHHCKRE